MIQFIPIFKACYHSISDQEENIDLIFESQLFKSSHLKLLEESLAKDRITQYTSCGIHKDDIHFLKDEHHIKKFGSQGEQKTFLIALKLAQFDFLKSKTGFSPILLLDDAFDKLDQLRVSQIVSLVDQNNFGQIFITDTHKDRTLQALSKTTSGYEIFNL